MKTNKYQREIKGTTVDVYDVLKAFDITCPAIQHALKKLLMPGQRGVKSYIEDIEEAIVSLNRSKELYEEQRISIKKPSIEDIYKLREMYGKHEKEVIEKQESGPYILVNSGKPVSTLYKDGKLICHGKKEYLQDMYDSLTGKKDNDVNEETE